MVDGPAIRNVNRGQSARIDSQKQPYISITFERFARIASSCDSQFLVPRLATRDSSDLRESGHIRNGGALQYTFEVNCSTFWKSSGGWGF